MVSTHYTVQVEEYLYNSEMKSHENSVWEPSLYSGTPMIWITVSLVILSFGVMSNYPCASDIDTDKNLRQNSRSTFIYHCGSDKIPLTAEMCIYNEFSRISIGLHILLGIFSLFYNWCIYFRLTSGFISVCGIIFQLLFVYTIFSIRNCDYFIQIEASTIRKRKCPPIKQGCSVVWLTVTFCNQDNNGGHYIFSRLLRPQLITSHALD